MPRLPLSGARREEIVKLVEQAAATRPSSVRRAETAA
jgi:hypothetical protein